MPESPAPKYPTMATRTRLGCHPRLGIPLFRRSWIMALVIAVSGVLLSVMAPNGSVGQSAYAQEVDSSFYFAENSTAPVAIFRAHDQDGDAIEWSLSGPDGDVFTIEGGVLAFRNPPDFEEPRSSTGGNVYRGGPNGRTRQARCGSDCGRTWTKPER